jgi:hypothetical protein
MRMNSCSIIFCIDLMFGCLTTNPVVQCDYTIDNIFAEAKVFHDSVVNSFLAGRDFLKPRVSSYSKHSSFDFGSFVPKDGKLDSLEYYEVGVDSDGMITEINHYEANPNLNNWRMVVFQTDDFIIAGVEDWTDDYPRSRGSYDFLPGFLLYVKTSKNLFFINTYHNQLSNVHFAPIFPVFESEDISYVACINESLQMTRLFKFGDGKLIYFTNIEVYEDKRTIMRETIYRPIVQDFILQDHTCLSDLDTYFDHNRDRSSTKVTKPCLPKNNPRFPLWFFGGGHTYCD